jgi:hypothetical protein
MNKLIVPIAAIAFSLASVTAFAADEPKTNEPTVTEKVKTGAKKATAAVKRTGKKVKRKIEDAHASAEAKGKPGAKTEPR